MNQHIRLPGGLAGGIVRRWAYCWFDWSFGPWPGNGPVVHEML